MEKGQENARRAADLRWNGCQMSWQG